MYMKYFGLPISILLFFFFSLNSIRSHGQQHTLQSKNAMNALPRNYTFFTAPAHDLTPEALQNNPGYESHPEIGMLFAETPCDNCYELIGKRTETSKTFLKEGGGGHDIMEQTSSAPMHYKDAQGNWLTIKAHLEPAAKGVYAALAQPIPVTIDANDRYSSLGNEREYFRFNNNLELVYAKPGGGEVSLGNADWTHHTAGDDGVYVTNAWPGVDIEMYVIRGAVKTNFIINHAMPVYADGTLLVRDHLQMSKSMTLFAQGQSTYAGNLEIRGEGGERLYAISAATAFDKEAAKKTVQVLNYHIDGNMLDIALPGNFLDRPASAYPVIIDPLVSAASTTAVTGSTYSPSWTTGCTYTNAATVPADVTVTDVQFTFQYVTSGGALLNNGAFDFQLGSCRSPVPTSLYWNCNSLLTGTCTGIDASIYPAIVSCLPPPQCTSYDMGLTMNFYQDYAADVACGTAYISAGTPLTITVFGHTIETSAITASPSIVCQGQSTTLTAATTYGVPPYSYVWTPGGSTGPSVTITPTGTTSYTVTSTDACGYSSTASTVITVNPIAPITGITTVCLGGSSPLNNSVTGGSWSSSNTTIATVGSISGLVTGNTTGTATITYTTAAGCVSTAVVTVNPPVAGISGTMAECQGNSTTLTDATLGGTWSSSNTSVATIGLTTGVVNGLTGGTTTISYITYGGGCIAMAVVTVNPVSPITGTTTVCYGGTTTLGNAVPGGTWSTGNSSVATVGSVTGVVSGASVGIAPISYTTPAGCSSVTSVIVNPLTPITGTPAVCQGSSTTLSDAVAGGTWSSDNTSVATVDISGGSVSGIAPGTALITYTTVTGCLATVSFTVNALPSAISGAALVCTSVTLTDGVAGGSWSSGNTSVATVGSSSGVVTGVSAGTVAITYAMPGGCYAIASLNVAPVSSITGAASVCQGQTASLGYPVAGGVWSSSNTAVATIDASGGTVLGLTAGTTTISYAVPTGCVATKIVSVNALLPISGSSIVCQGTTTILSDIPGGTWSSGTVSVATIGLSSGVLGGVSAGTSVITFTSAAGCSTTKLIGVNPSIAITGSAAFCQGSTSALSDAVAGGTWVSMNPVVATVDASAGTVTGVSPGTSIIRYTTVAGCIQDMTVTVNALPATILGASSVCQGATTTLVEALSGGSWSSSDPGVASVTAATGTVYGIAAGPVIISYITAAGCFATTTMTVNPISAVTGVASMCAGSTTTLGDATADGSWSSTNTAVATADPALGVISGVSAGTSVISYTTDAGCVATRIATVYAFPSAVGGTLQVCDGSTTTLTNTLAGGTWSSANTTVATIGVSSGIVLGLSASTANITYTTTGNCFVTTTITVHPLPAAISGVLSLCARRATPLFLMIRRAAHGAVAAP